MAHIPPSPTTAATPDPAVSPSVTPADDGKRSSGGSNYGDFVPARRQGTGLADPSKGSELERDTLPADADFGTPLDKHKP